MLLSAFTLSLTLFFGRRAQAKVSWAWSPVDTILDVFEPEDKHFYLFIFI